MSHAIAHDLDVACDSGSKAKNGVGILLGLST